VVAISIGKPNRNDFNTSPPSPSCTFDMKKRIKINLQREKYSIQKTTKNRNE
jgi:hypothetical protein